LGALAVDGRMTSTAPKPEASAPARSGRAPRSGWRRMVSRSGMAIAARPPAWPGANVAALERLPAGAPGAAAGA
jgi:hypothetical protein